MNTRAAAGIFEILFDGKFKCLHWSQNPTHKGKHITPNQAHLLPNSQNKMFIELIRQKTHSNN